MPSAGLVFDLLARDKASPAFARLGGVVDKAALAEERFGRAELENTRIANRLRIAELEVAAATERHSKVAASASTSIASQARSEIALIRANEGLAEAQLASGAAAAKSARAHSLAGKAATAGAVASRKLTLPLLALGGVAIHEAMQYEKGLTTVQIAAHRTNKEMAQSSRGLLNVSRETATGTDQLTESYYVASKAGLSVSKSLDITRAAAQGAKAEGADLGTVTNALTSIMASYGSKLRDPVAAMNMLVRGAGLAKTTTQDYAGSLSTVIPLASAAGLGFDQIGGALATLTQHGTSADQATQELAFGIRNLQAPNNVAIAAMNQMGISAIDISKNLGKRGLTGTFDYITSKLPKSALVYVGAMKKMEAGTGDLELMQSKMPPALKLASKGFLDGSISAREFRKSYRDMGAEGNAQGRAFLTLSQKVKGYSDAVKSGTPAQKTAVSLLKQMLGGANGLNNYLQLSGESAHYFAGATKQVGDAAKHAGKDVLGFDEAKKTAAFKQQELMATIKADVIELGTALLPMFNKIVGGISDAVHWFDQLSGTTKGVLGWSTVTVTGIGAVLSVSSKLGGAAAGMAKFAQLSSTTATRVGTSMQRIGTAVGGLALAYGGTQVHGAGGAIMGALGGGLTGAAIGSFFSPIGTAVGGVVGAVIGLGAHFLSTGDDADDAGKRAAAAAQEAKQRIQEQQQAVESLTSAIAADSLALGKNTRAQVVNDLGRHKPGSNAPSALQLAQRAGIDPHTVVSSVMGNQKAQGRLQGQINAVGANLATKGLTRETSAQSQALGKLLIMLREEGVLLAKGGRDADLQQIALGKLNLATRSVGAQVKIYGKTLDQSTINGRMNNKFIEDRVTALNKEHNAGKLTQRQWLRQLGTLDSQAVKLGLSSDAVAKYVGAYSKIPKSVATRLLANPAIARSAIGEVLRSIAHIPASKSTKLSANPALAKMSIAQLQTRINALRQGLIPGINANTDLGKSAVAELQSRIDALQGKNVGIGVNIRTKLTGPGASKLPAGAFSGLNLFGANGGVVRFFGNGGIAGDRKDMHEAQIARPGDWRIFGEPETGGESYIPHAASKRSRSRRILAQTAKILGGVAMFAKGGIVSDVHKVKGGWEFDDHFYATEKGAKNARNRAALDAAQEANLRRAPGVYRVGKGYGYEGQYFDKKKDANAAQRDDHRAAAAAARYHSPEQRATVRDDLTGYRSAIAQGDLSGTRSAYETLIKDAQAAGASKTTLDRLARSEKTVIADLQRRATVTEQASKAQEHLSDLQSKAADMRSSIRSAVTGTFDITASSPQMFNDRAGGGSPAAIIASLRAKADKAVAFDTLLRKLGKAGLPQSFLEQLAMAGPTPEAFNAATALSKATPKEMASIRSENARLSTAGASLGGYVADRAFGSQIAVAKALLNGYDPKRNPHMAAAVKALGKSLFGVGKLSGQGLEHGLLGQKKSAGDAAAKLGDEVQRRLRASLGIHSPSRVTRELGHHTGVGFALGLRDTVGMVSDASSAVGSAGVPSSGIASSGGSGQGGTTNITHNWTINEADGGMETAHRVMRRLALAGP